MKKATAEQNRQIVITEFDLERLQRLIEEMEEFPARDNRYLDELSEELLRAEVVAPEEIPPQVITMNSRVRLQDLDSKAELEYTLVFPPEANLDQGKISVLAPVGMAMIGYRVGDTISWKVPAGLKRLKVKKILYQPEAAGDFNV
ncbi:MAG: nucleoside diphosphate kinase regulator [Geobacter sp.]|jgi:regulator of nucleoside diphosphate kinase|uniref:nucleoside diphosphate kinase regulator n=1 Tax=Trichlorobacter sp. TaxID=2911007 RepID=UPI002A369FE4|nr:nucleoside diphosphate kinase regulator [Trichlorobacter sp.]MDY0384416.1 nucleoside diphosphate kinase regulator [Trichlorobacter sp.]